MLKGSLVISGEVIPTEHACRVGANCDETFVCTKRVYKCEMGGRSLAGHLRHQIQQCLSLQHCFVYRKNGKKDALRGK